MLIRRATAIAFTILAIFAFSNRQGNAQAALLLEEPYGFFGTLAPIGHNAIYFEHICAETPVRLRRCEAGEMGAAIARYQGISGYDWIAVPLIPYLYSVEDAAQVPDRVDHATVKRLRDQYHEAHLLTLGEKVPKGGAFRGGWTELVGAAYERRIYAIRFDTTPEQDDAFIARMNAGPNQSHFEYFYNNCSDFARGELGYYFPSTFHRSFFPDAFMTTPKQLAWKLERYSLQHPDVHVTVFEIPQVPGYRRKSHSNKGVAEALATTLYAIPIAVVNPYLAGGLFVDYLVRSRYRLVPKNVQILSASDLSALTAPASAPQASESAGIQAPAAAVVFPQETKVSEAAYSGQKEMKVTHE